MPLGAEKSLEIAILRLAIIICGYLASYAQGSIIFEENSAFYYIATVAVIVPSICALLPMCTPKRLFKVAAAANLLVTCYAAGLAFPNPVISMQTSWFIVGASIGICFIYLIIWQFAGRAVSLISMIASVATVGSTYELWFGQASICTEKVASEGVIEGLKACGINAEEKGIWAAVSTAITIVAPLSVILTFALILMKRTCKIFCSQLRLFQGMMANFTILLSVNIGMYSVSLAHALASSRTSELINLLQNDSANSTAIAESYGLAANSSYIDSILEGKINVDKVKDVLSAITPFVSSLAMTFLCLSLLWATHGKSIVRPRSLSSKQKRPPEIARAISREMAMV